MTSANNAQPAGGLPTRFHRRKSKLKQMFIGSLGNLVGLKAKTLQYEHRRGGSELHSLQGLFLMLDYRARKVYSQCVEVRYAHGDGRVSFRIHDRMRYSRDKLQYLWTDSGRWKRVKGPPPKLNRVEDKNQYSANRKRKERSPTQLLLNWSRKGREGYRSDRKIEEVAEIVSPISAASSEYCDSSEEEDWSSEYPDVKPKKRPYEKSIKCSSKRYLLGKCGASHNSKAWSRELEGLKLTTIDSADCSVIDQDDDCLGNVSSQVHLLTFGDFCSSPILKKYRKSKASKSETTLFITSDRSLNESGAKDVTLELKHDVRENFQENTSNKRSFKSQPVVQQKSNYIMVKLSRTQTRPDVLSTEFKMDYREAPCKSRRFVLNISRLMYQHAILMTRLRIKLLPKLDLSTYLVFTFSQALGPEVDEYRMAVNSAWPDLSAQAALEKRNASNEFTPLQELILEVVHSLDGINQTRFKLGRDGERLKRPISPVCLFNILNNVAQWETNSISLPYTTEWCVDDIEYSHSTDESSDRVFVDIMNILKNKIDYALDAINLGPNTSHLCGVCLSEFSSGESLENRVFPLALTVCSHWFCEECWRSRILIHLRNGHKPHEVPCPERDCPSKLDPVTILSVFSILDIRKINKIKIESYVAKTSMVTFCPGPACHRLLWARPRDMSRRTSIIVTCACNTQVCFNCRLKPHWPTPCAVAQKYHQELASNGDEVLNRILSEMEFPEVVMRGKRCPSCGLLILQPSSSKTNACSCGCHFCWPCGKEIKDKDDHHQRCVETFQHSDTVLKDIVNNGPLTRERESKMSRWYGTALTHRKMRHPDVVLALYSMAESMAKNISNLHESGHYVGDIDTAARGWSRCLVPWAQENYDNLYVLNDLNSDSRSVNENSRSTSRASSTSLFNESGIASSSIAQATENIVQTKLELHHIIEYTSVLLARAVPVPAKLAQCLERAEDLCTTFGILLQNKQNCRQVLPAFLRVKAKVRQIVGQILTTIEEIPPGVFKFEEDDTMGTAKP